MRVGGGARAFEGEQEASADDQPLRVDVGRLVEGLADAAVVVMQQPAMELRGDD